MRKKLRYFIPVTLITAMLMTGCATASSDNTSSSSSTASSSSTSTDTNASTEATASATSTILVNKEFTANDLEVGYEDSTATHITLDGSIIEVSGDGAEVSDGVLTISSEGTYVITGTLTDGQIVVNAGAEDKIQIVLNGVTINCSDSAPIYVKAADKVFITLEENTVNTLTDGTNYVQTDDNTVDAVIFSTADLTINGKGTLNINANYEHGIVSKDDLVFTGGTYNITASKDAINGKESVKIQDGTFTLDAANGDGIQSKNDEDNTTGYVYITGGTITITNSLEGIEGTAIVVEGGIIDLTASDDGFNATSGSSTTTTTQDTTSNLTTTDVEVVQVSTTGTTTGTTADTDTTTTQTTDDQAFVKGNGGFGGKGGGGMENDTNAYISISGGIIKVNAGGDGLDSNGSIYISGGETYVSGPTDNNNAGMDYNGTADITGGTIVVAGSAGMAQGFSNTSTQYSLLNNFTSGINGGTEITLTDANGNVVVSFTPDKTYQSVVISSPSLEKGATYTLTSGDQTADITLSSIVTSNGQASGFGMGGGMQRPGKGN